MAHHRTGYHTLVAVSGVFADCRNRFPHPTPVLLLTASTNDFTHA
jgi:hypothetical protein